MIDAFAIHQRNQPRQRWRRHGRNNGRLRRSQTDANRSTNGDAPGFERRAIGACGKRDRITHHQLIAPLPGTRTNRAGHDDLVITHPPGRHTYAASSNGAHSVRHRQATCCRLQHNGRFFAGACRRDGNHNDVFVQGQRGKRSSVGRARVSREPAFRNIPRLECRRIGDQITRHLGHTSAAGQ